MDDSSAAQQRYTASRSGRSTWQVGHLLAPPGRRPGRCPERRPETLCCYSHCAAGGPFSHWAMVRGRGSTHAVTRGLVCFCLCSCVVLLLLGQDHMALVSPNCAYPRTPRGGVVPVVARGGVQYLQNNCGCAESPPCPRVYPTREQRRFPAEMEFTRIYQGIFGIGCACVFILGPGR